MPDERFMAFVVAVPWSGCWIWTGGLSGEGRGGGYGRFSYLSQTVAAHRWSYMRWVGPIRSGMVLDHVCEVRCCVNPHHLEQVTNIENQRRKRSRRTDDRRT